MATFTTATYDAQKVTRTSPSRNLAPNIVSNDVEFARIKHIFTTEAAADLIQLCVLPAGCIPLPELSSLTMATDPGTALTVKVGTADDDDGWAAAVATTVAGKVNFCEPSATQPAWLVETPLVADTGAGNAIVYATVSTATALTNPTTGYFMLAYKRGR